MNRDTVGRGEFTTSTKRLAQGCPCSLMSDPKSLESSGSGIRSPHVEAMCEEGQGTQVSIARRWREGWIRLGKVDKEWGGEETLPTLHPTYNMPDSAQFVRERCQASHLRHHITMPPRTITPEDSWLARVTFVSPRRTAISKEGLTALQWLWLPLLQLCAFVLAASATLPQLL